MVIEEHDLLLRMEELMLLPETAKKDGKCFLAELRRQLKLTIKEPGHNSRTAV